MTWKFRYRVYINGEPVLDETYLLGPLNIDIEPRYNDPDAEEIEKEKEEERKCRRASQA